VSSDLTLPVRRLLVNTPAVVGLLGTSPEWATWLWRWSAYEVVEGTGLVGMTLRQGTWTVPSPWHTTKYPELQAIIYADRTRDDLGRPTKEDAEEKALRVADAVDAVLHVPQGGELSWDGVRVVSSVRQSEPDVVQAPDSDGMIRATSRYAVVLG
jgi:hypothetical protein